MLPFIGQVRDRFQRPSESQRLSYWLKTEVKFGHADIYSVLFNGYGFIQVGSGVVGTGVEG